MGVRRKREKAVGVSPPEREREKEGVKGGRKNNPFDKSQQIFGPRREGYFFFSCFLQLKIAWQKYGRRGQHTKQERRTEVAFRGSVKCIEMVHGVKKIRPVYLKKET